MTELVANSSCQRDDPTAMQDDIHQQIENALRVVGAQRHQVQPQVAQTLALAFDALKAARAALDESDEQLAIVTDPERDMAVEVQRLTHELEQERARADRAEQATAVARADKEVEDLLHAEDSKRIDKLEKKAQSLDAVLMKDDGAFGRFMENALDEQDRKGGGKPGQR